METSHIIFLAVSASISFAIGRTVMHLRKKKTNLAKAQADRKAAQALRDFPPGLESKNKAKRRRHLRAAQRTERLGTLPEINSAQNAKK